MTESSLPYAVYVDDNFHYMDSSHRYLHARFASHEAAVEACRRIVAEYLDSALKPGMTAKQLYESYCHFGDDPYIVAPQGFPQSPFSAWDYARERSNELCAVPYPLSPLERAIRIAKTAHEGQVDKAGMPYFLHPMKVMSQVKTEDEKIVAVLHDVVEDTAVTLDDLRREGFAESLIEAVDALTKRPGESRMDAARRLRPNLIARAVKIADVRHNLDPSRLRNPGPADERRMAEYREVLQYLLSGK